MMLTDQFDDYGGRSTDIAKLRIRAQLFALGATRATDWALAKRLYHHSRAFAQRAQYLENHLKEANDE